MVESAQRELAFFEEVGFDDVKQVALARLLVSNIDSIQVDWPLYGPKLAQVALSVGADGSVVQMVPLSLMCRHTVGLNYTAIGIEHVGFRDADVLGNARELRASLQLTQRPSRRVAVLSHSGFMFPVAHPELAAVAIGEFLKTPVEWYSHLALGTSRHARVSLSEVTVPVAFVAGTFDILAGARHMATAAARLADATYVELRGSHFLQMEHPDRVHALLVEFLERVS